MKYMLFFFGLIAYSTATPQDGKIIDQTLFKMPDAAVNNVEKLAPGIKSIISTINFYHITYLSDGLKVKGYMALPKRAGKYPCVIYNRGGNREAGKITDEGFLTRGLAEISSKGYVIVASQYRGNDGGEGREEFGGKDLNDVLNLIPLLANLPQADTSKIGMLGWSRGGMMTYLALCKTTKIKAAVVGSGVTDLIKSLETRPDFDTAVYAPLIPGYAANKTAALQDRSAIYFAGKINKTTPVLILQGTADWRVPANQVLDLVNKFYQLKQPFRLILYEGGQHSLIEHRKDYITQTVNWFDAYLRDGKSLPNLDPHGD